MKIEVVAKSQNKTTKTPLLRLKTAVLTNP